VWILNNTTTSTVPTYTKDAVPPLGWNMSPTGTGAAYLPGTTNIGVADLATVYAQWMAAVERELPIYISAIKVVPVLGVESVTMTVKAMPEAVGTTELFDLRFIGIDDLLNPVGFAPLSIPGSFGGPYTVNQIRDGVTFTFEVTPGNKMFFYRAVSKESN